MPCKKKFKKKRATGKINGDVVLDFYANGISSSFKIIGSKKKMFYTSHTGYMECKSSEYRSCYAIRIVTYKIFAYAFVGCVILNLKKEEAKKTAVHNVRQQITSRMRTRFVIIILLYLKRAVETQPLTMILSSINSV